MHSTNSARSSVVDTEESNQKHVKGLMSPVTQRATNVFLFFRQKFEAHRPFLFPRASSIVYVSYLDGVLDSLGILPVLLRKTFHRPEEEKKTKILMNISQEDENPWKLCAGFVLPKWRILCYLDGKSAFERWWLLFFSVRKSNITLCPQGLELTISCPPKTCPSQSLLGFRSNERRMKIWRKRKEKISKVHFNSDHVRSEHFQNGNPPEDL